MTFYAISLIEIDASNLTDSNLIIAHGKDVTPPAIDGVHFIALWPTEWAIALATGVVGMVITTSRELADQTVSGVQEYVPDGTYEYRLEPNGDISVADLAQNDIPGTPGDDVLNGTILPEVLYGYGGNDELNGRGANDVLRGGFGHDTLRGGAGNDTLDGGSGRDVLFGGNGRDKLIGGDHRDRLFGGTDQDTLYGGRGNDLLKGMAGSDILSGGAHNDVLLGGAGYDDLSGNGGDDFLNAGRQGGIMRGGAGNDRFDWVSGGATMWGGPGADVFVYRANNAQTGNIRDFQHGIDLIDLRLAGVTSFDELTLSRDFRSVTVNDFNDWLVVYTDTPLVADDFIFFEPV